jgi:hypothetical protein
MSPKTARADVLLIAALTGVGPLVRVQPLVQLEMDELGEFGGTKVASVRLLAGVQSKVGFQIRSGTEPLLAYLTLVWFLA